MIKTGENRRIPLDVCHDGRYFWIVCPELGGIFSCAENYGKARDGFYDLLINRARDLSRRLYNGLGTEDDAKYVRFVFENKSNLKTVFISVYTYGFSRN